MPSPVTPTQLAKPSPASPRKRTSSFSITRPNKAPRMALKRTESYITFPGTRNISVASSPVASSCAADSLLVPHHRTMQAYKEKRERRKLRINRSLGEGSISIVTSPSYTRAPLSIPNAIISYMPARPLSPCPRTSSPLAPTRTPLPPRPTFPRSKPEPDLYRKAITTRMRYSPEGQKILHMGPRLALSIAAATKELEKIVAAQMDGDGDVAMADGSLSNSWVVVPGEDWEMVDCSA